MSGKNRLFIRGIGLTSTSNGVDPSSVYNVDGVVVARPAAQLSSFYDAERVEVLRGPQGTLYGRNASGGAINIITSRPSEDFGGYFRVTAGEYNTLNTRGAITGALDKSGTILARFAFSTNSHSGWGKNLFTGSDVNDQNEKAGRLSLWFKPSSSFDYLVTAEYSHENDKAWATSGFGPPNGGAFTLGPIAGLRAATTPFDVNSAKDPSNLLKTWAVSGIGRLSLNDAVTINSITGYRFMRHTNLVDGDTTPVTFGEFTYDELSRQFSQELSAAYDSERIKGIVGLFYFHERLRGFLDVPGFRIRFDGSDVGDGTTAKAAFTQWTVEPVKNLRLTGGVRYSHEERTHAGFLFSGANKIPLSGDATFSATTPKFGIDYQFGNGMIYASYTRGFKSGGYVLGNANPLFRPERVGAWEAGIKGTLFDRRLQVTLAAFDNKFNDLQIQRITNLTTTLVNANKAKVKGVELSLEAKPTNWLTLTENASYIDAKFGTFVTPDPANAGAQTDLAGNRLPGAPRWSLNTGVQMRHEFTNGAKLQFDTNISYKSRIFFDEFNRSFTSQGANTRTDLSLRYTVPNGRYSVTGFVTNVTNEAVVSTKIYTNSFNTVSGVGPGLVFGSYQAPRTIGVEFAVEF